MHEGQRVAHAHAEVRGRRRLQRELVGPIGQRALHDARHVYAVADLLHLHRADRVVALQDDERQAPLLHVGHAFHGAQLRQVVLG